MTTLPLWVPISQSPPAFVIDASIPLEVWFGPSSPGYATDVMSRMSSAVAAVPESWPLELANLLAKRERARQLTAARSDWLLSIMCRFEIFLDGETGRRAWSEILPLARARRLAASSAAYLELALRLNLPLATTDSALIRAASAAGIPIFNP